MNLPTQVTTTTAMATTEQLDEVIGHVCELDQAFDELIIALTVIGYSWNDAYTIACQVGSGRSWIEVPPLDEVRDELMSRPDGETVSQYVRFQKEQAAKVQAVRHALEVEGGR